VFLSASLAKTRFSTKHSHVMFGLVSHAFVSLFQMSYGLQEGLQALWCSFFLKQRWPGSSQHPVAAQLEPSSLTGSLHAGCTVTIGGSITSQSQTFSVVSTHPLSHFLFGAHVSLHEDQCLFFLKQVRPASRQHPDNVQSDPAATHAGAASANCNIAENTAILTIHIEDSGGCYPTQSFVGTNQRPCFF